MIDVGLVAGLLQPVVGATVPGLIERVSRSHRVARAVDKRARREGIRIHRGVLRRHLGNKATLIELMSSDPNGYPLLLDAANAALRGGLDDVSSSRLVEVIAEEYVAKLPTRESIQVHTSRTAADVRRDIERVAAVSVSDGDFRESLRSFHPLWRAEASKLRPQWPRLAQLVMELSDPRARAATLAQWSEHPPDWWNEAPSSVIAWLGLVAQDAPLRGDVPAALFGAAAERGATPRVIWLFREYRYASTPRRAEIMGGFEDEQHPLAAALRADEARDYEKFDSALRSWEPEDDPSRALRLELQVNVARMRDHTERAKRLARDSLETLQQANAGVILAEMLAREATLDETRVRRSARLVEAAELALRARDMQRAWGQSSSEAVKVAVASFRSAGALERALQLCIGTPDGDATPTEASDSWVTAARHVLSAQQGRDVDLDSAPQEVQLTVRGYQARAAGNTAEAAAAWREAYDLQQGAQERVQLAIELAFIGVEVDISELPVVAPVDLAAELSEVAAFVRDPDNPALLARVQYGATKRPPLALELHAFHARRGDHTAAAAVATAAAVRWGDAEFWLRAAQSLADAGDYSGALSAATQAASAGSQVIGLEREARARMIEASSALGDWDAAASAAQLLLALDPSSHGARWASIKCEEQRGRPDRALQVLRDAPRGFAPRSADEVVELAQLYRLYGAQALTADNLVEASEPWKNDEGTIGRVLLCIVMSVDGAAEDEELRESASGPSAAVSAAFEAFWRTFPHSQLLRSISVDLDHPLESLLQALGEAPDTSEFDQRVRLGQLPLGMAAELHSRTYAYTAIVLPAEARFGGPESELSAAQRSGPVVLDTTGALALSLFDEASRIELIGAFSNLVVPRRLLLDAQEAARAIRRDSGISFVPGAGEGGMIRETADDVLRARVDRAEALVQIFESLPISPAERAPHPIPGLQDSNPIFLESLRQAAHLGGTLWADDAAIRAVAGESGVPSLNTWSAISAAESGQILVEPVARGLRARLIADGHVGQIVTTRDFRDAGELHGWKLDGLARNLRHGNVATYRDRVEMLVLAVQHSSGNPGGAQQLVYAHSMWALTWNGGAGDREPAIVVMIWALLRRGAADERNFALILAAIQQAHDDQNLEFTGLRTALHAHLEYLAERSSIALAAQHLRSLMAGAAESHRLVATEVILAAGAGGSA